MIIISLCDNYEFLMCNDNMDSTVAGCVAGRKCLACHKAAA